MVVVLSLVMEPCLLADFLGAGLAASPLLDEAGAGVVSGERGLASRAWVAGGLTRGLTVGCCCSCC